MKINSTASHHMNQHNFLLILVFFIFTLFCGVEGIRNFASSSPSNFNCDLYVFQSGFDNPTCGNISVPCKTIQQAVDNSPEGNIICVKADPIPFTCPKPSN